MHVNIIFMAFICLLSLGYTVMASTLSLGTLSMPGPGMIPLLAGSLATVLSACLLFADYRKFRFDKNERSDYPLRIVFYLLSFIIYILMFKPVGYVISTILLTTVLFLIMENKWYISLLVGIATGIVFYLVFSFLAVPLPRGLLSAMPF